jgi:lysophospholipase L1-like esterase
MDAICTGNTKYDWTVYDDGLPGYKAQDIYVYSAVHGWKNQGADIVLIMAGTNDLVQAGNKDPQSYINSVVSAVQRIVDYYTFDNSDSRPKVIVSAIPPSTNSGITSLASTYNKELENALKGYGVDIFMTSNWVDFLDTSTGTAKSSMYSDYLHPTQDGYYAMAENFFDAIRALYNPDYFKTDTTLHKMPDYASF